MTDENDDKKKGWVVPAASVEAIRHEDGELFKEAFLAMHDYNMGNDVDIMQLSPAARVLFMSFRETMDANVMRYEAIKKRNASISKAKNKSKKEK